MKHGAPVLIKVQPRQKSEIVDKASKSTWKSISYRLSRITHVINLWNSWETFYFKQFTMADNALK